MRFMETAMDDRRVRVRVSVAHVVRDGDRLLPSQGPVRARELLAKLRTLLEQDLRTGVQAALKGWT